MSYDVKVLLIAIAEIVSKSDDVEEIYKAIELMANAEGVILKPFSEKRKKD